MPSILFTYSAGVVIDITLRIGWPQLELGAFATSPIRTTSAAVTRAADDVALDTAASSSWLTGGVSGTIYSEALIGDTSIERVVVIVWDGATNNRINHSLGAGVARSFIGNGGATQYNVSSGVPASGNLWKIAVGYTTNNVNSASNGTIAGVDDVASTTPTIDRVRFGGISAFNSPFNSYVRRVAYIPSRISNAELQAITT